MRNIIFILKKYTGEKGEGLQGYRVIGLLFMDSRFKGDLGGILNY